MSTLSLDNNTIELTLGENGTPELTLNAISEKLVALFFKLVRGCSTNDVKTLYDSVINETKDNPELAQSKITSLITLAFMTRSCRGGKGERELFYNLFKLLNEDFPETTSELCKIISHYGYWKDCLNLIAKNMVSKDTIKAILDIIANQIEKDLDLIKENKAISLLGKWLPRESKSLYKAINHVLHNNNFNGFSSEIISRISQQHKQSLTGSTSKKYRLLVTSISAKLNLVESHMCGQGQGGTEMLWNTIDFSAVPSLAMRKYNHAFDLTPVSNLPKNKRNKNSQLKPRKISDEKMEDRLLCKAKYIEHLTSGTINGSQIAIEKLVEDVISKCNKLRSNGVFNTETLQQNGYYDLLLANKQFESYCDYVEEQLNKASLESNENEKSSFNIDDIELMLDVSGSMEGVPMNACIGLGLVITELQRRKSKNKIMKFMTFDSNPTYVTLDETMNFVERVVNTTLAPWGGSTNIVAAIDLMLNSSGHNVNHAKKKLMIFSDMQFDTAFGIGYRNHNNTSTGWETMYDTICEKWNSWYNLTETESDKLINITFWNLRGNTTGFPVDSNTRGVTQISGFSASLVKMILFGDELAQTVSTEDENKNVKKQPTPAEVLHRTLMAKEYDLVRTTLQSVSSVFNREIDQLLNGQKVTLSDLEGKKNVHLYFSSDSESDEEIEDLDINIEDIDQEYPIN